MNPRPPSFEQELLALARRLSHVPRTVSQVVESILARLQKNVEGKSEGEAVDVELTRQDLEAMRFVYSSASHALGKRIDLLTQQRRALEGQLQRMETQETTRKAQAEQEHRSREEYIRWKASQDKRPAI